MCNISCFLLLFYFHILKRYPDIRENLTRVAGTGHYWVCPWDRDIPVSLCDGWMDGWMCGLVVGGWVDEWMDGCVGG